MVDRLREGLASTATTVNTLFPRDSGPVHDQVAMPEPLAVPPEAARPFTDTALTPLLPRLPSEAEPLSVIELDVTVAPEL